MGITFRQAREAIQDAGGATDRTERQEKMDEVNFLMKEAVNFVARALVIRKMYAIEDGAVSAEEDNTCFASIDLENLDFECNVGCQMDLLMQ